jgi:hypothetical protein
MCTLNVLKLHWLISIEQDRNVYLNIAIVTVVKVYKTGPVCVYLNTATVTPINVYRKGPVCVYLNIATVTLVNV